MGQGKILRYSHRLMHRKRVTCELHDSYFCLMTIKYAIPGTAEVTHPDGQLWGDIEWAIELLYNSVKTGSQLVGDQMSWCEDAVERTAPSRGGPRAPGWAAQENGKKIRLWPIEWGLICCSSVRSPTLSHSKTLSNPFELFQIKWEIYFSKRLCRSSSWRQYVFCMYMCIYPMNQPSARAGYDTR